MSVAANLLPSTKSTRKQVLQQSNYNFDVSPEKTDNYDKLINSRIGREEDSSSQETENQFDPKKNQIINFKSDSKKLRTIRFDSISSLKKRGGGGGAAAAIYQTINHTSSKTKTEFISDESGEEEPKEKKRKTPRPVVPNYVTNSDVGPCRKPRQSKRQDQTMISSQDVAGKTSAKSQPLSIARRNARERNRVKQVNEGFATLRSRIPDYISEAYNEEKGRKTAKKLSKVETLRMAVDYIRHLETLLDLRTAESESDWGREIKTEIRPWDTPKTSSGDCPSPESRYESSPPGTIYDQALDYQDRIFYDYDLGFLGRKEIFVSDKRPPEPSLIALAPTGSQNENDCPDDFKYYESFERLKGGEEEEEERDPSSRKNEEKTGEPEMLEEFGSEVKEPEVHPTSKDAIKKNVSHKTVLPSIVESFNKGIAVFY